MVCRDVWALHLDTLRDPVPPEPLNHAQLEGGHDLHGYDANKGNERSSGWSNEAGASAPSAKKAASSPTTPERGGGKGSTANFEEGGGNNADDDARSSSESDLDESELDEGESVWRHSCRCGGSYVITEKEMEMGQHLTGCNGCSEVVWIGYELAPDSDEDPDIIRQEEENHVDR